MIKILPNIYLCTNTHDILDNNLSCNNIDSIIIFTENMDNINNFNKTNNEQNILSNGDGSLNIKNIIQTYPINFNYVENIILNYLTFSKNLLIISKDNLYGFAVISYFIMKYLKTSLLDIIALSMYHKINIKNTLEYQELLNFDNLLKKY